MTSSSFPFPFASIESTSILVSLSNLPSLMKLSDPRAKVGFLAKQLLQERDICLTFCLSADISIDIMPPFLGRAQVTAG